MQTAKATWFDNPAAEGSSSLEPTYLDAVRLALQAEMDEDEKVVLLGEDIGVMGGAFRATAGLFERFGSDRVIDTPLAETALVGAGIGLAITGWRPVVELQFADFISCAYDQLVTEAAKLHYRFGIAVPLVVRAPSGAGVGAGPFHSQSPEGIFAHVPGLKVVCPGDVQDAYDLLRAAIRDPNPVLYFEHKALYRSLRGPLVQHPPNEGLGHARVRREGTGLTLVTYGGMVPRCLEAADALEEEQGLDVEVIDLRVVSPLDRDVILASAHKTGRVLIVHEDNITAGIGAEIAALISSEAFFDLDAPVQRLAAPDTPVPFASTLESEYLPSVARIRAVALDLARL